MKSLSRWFSNQNIHKKLFQSNALIVAVAVIPLVTAMLIYEYFDMRSMVLQEIRVKADIVSDSAAAALAFHDQERANDALGTLKASEEIQFSYLVLPDYSILAKYSKLPSENISEDVFEITQSEEILNFRSFTLIKPVYLHASFVGTIVLKASLDIFYERIQLQLIFTLIASAAALALSLVLSIHLRNVITLPIETLVNFVKKVNDEQDYSARPPIFSKDEIGQLSSVFSDMMSSIQERDERLKGLAFFDEVTGLPNRNYFKERINQVVSNSVRYNTVIALLFVDLDDFKTVNDTLGHEAGDILLRIIGERFKTTLRSSDMVFRLGGDEFAVILENYIDVKNVAKLAEKIIKSISKEVVLGNDSVTVGASIGISLCPKHAADASTLLILADSAMYVAKARSKNTYYIYSEKDTKKNT